ncbi:metallophosphoesterase [Macrococcus equipercicus]|uniref:Metallophosphoesterase n=1 Tax=Macrococcus equipercicus TaxID=69967 RepID=A0A9Q9BR94_9STAP|nr:metallophosphoesterase [Macrococcus equipercicus]KAA1042351.1 hypothetical protein ERX35_000270 [Macrococcus equipercicus]UTH14236.1 metallophosphoesterase [Macrococcus equipercicus]
MLERILRLIMTVIIFLIIPSKLPVPLLQFGMFTDAQYCDCAPEYIPSYQSHRYFLATPAKMTEAVRTFNSRPLAFTIQLGDTIDRDYQSFSKMIPLYQQLKSPRYDVLGNHDFPGHNNAAMSALHMEHNYYTFVKQNIRFIVLDTNEISTYAHPKTSTSYALAQHYLTQAKNSARPYALESNGAVSSRQLAWLNTVLKTAKTARQPVILFSHHAVYPLYKDNVLNREKILELIDKYDNVQVYFNGHTHNGKYHVRKGVHYVNLKGMVETPDQNAYSIIKLYDNHMQIDGYGREVTRTLQFRKIY